MRVMRRLVLSIGVGVSLAATLTVASVGAAGGFGQSGGKFTFTDTSGNASFFDQTTEASWNISVDRSMFEIRQRPGGQLQTEEMTVLNVNYFVPNPSDPTLPPVVQDFACLVIPDSDFVVSADLQTATLTAVNESTPCPFFIAPVSGGVQLAKGGGGGGAVVGFTLPLTVMATWTGTGLVGISDDQGTFRCGTFVSTTHNHNLTAFSSSIAASIPEIGFSGGPNPFGMVQQNTNTQIVAGTGIMPSGCFGAKGGG